MVNRMVLRYDKSPRALDKWLHDFSITNFSGENVALAPIRIKAVANAIGHDKLPSESLLESLMK
jgi:hypothetical protein